jgi:hypothetical protein
MLTATQLFYVHKGIRVVSVTGMVLTLITLLNCLSTGPINLFCFLSQSVQYSPPDRTEVSEFQPILSVQVCVCCVIQSEKQIDILQLVFYGIYYES